MKVEETINEVKSLLQQVNTKETSKSTKEDEITTLQQEIDDLKLLARSKLTTIGIDFSLV